MRTIKFRGIDTGTGEWVYGIPMIDPETFMPKRKACIPQFVGIESGDSIWDYIYVDVNTISQFTGLHDKNGKEIYEGDICNHPDHLNHRVIYFNPLSGFFSNFLEGTDPNYLEVIGNIYENPELL